MGPEPVGTVAGLRRYPVKSMLGEDLTACGVTAGGLDGDRRLALVDRGTGKVVSAKNPRLWRRVLQLSASLGSDPLVKISFPHGAVTDSADPGVDAALSEFLGREVIVTAEPPAGAELDRSVPEEVLRDGVEAQVNSEVVQLGGASPAGTFFDFAPVHLLTTSTLEQIAGYSPRGTVEARRYRPNLVIQVQEPGFVENDWAGRDLRIGNELVIRVVARTPRCAIPTLEHGDLPRDTDALRVPAIRNRVSPREGLDPQPCAGAYAQVVRPGLAQAGDEVWLEPPR